MLVIALNLTSNISRYNLRKNLKYRVSLLLWHWYTLSINILFLIFFFILFPAQR